MIVFDKAKIRSALTEENVFDLLAEWGGEPSRETFGFLSTTICHNRPGEGSRKLYYYKNTDLFRCYTGCANGTFDLFELVIKVAKLQWNKEFDLNDAVRWVAQKFGLSGESETVVEGLDDWKVLANYEKLQDIKINIPSQTLKEYDSKILQRLNYNVKIKPWLDEGISQEVIDNAMIGYYLGGDQITIPHFDKDGRFVGLRGRALCRREAELFGKYRPLKINRQLYNHALGFNLYGLNWSKDNIARMGKAIVFESEKSVLRYASEFGWENNISVACCGSNLSAHQMQLLLDLGVQEVIIAFDRQFQAINDDEYKHLKANLLKIRDRYKNLVMVSFIFDKGMITKYKASPIDESKEKFLKLFKERIVL